MNIKARLPKGYYYERLKVLEEIVLEANPDYKIIHQYKKMYAYIPKQLIKQ